MLQQILAYMILALALTYLVHRFVVPIPFRSSKRKDTTGCGNGDCGCK